MAETFVGENFVETQYGESWQLTSSDGLRTVRGPVVKPTDAGRNVHPVSGEPYSTTGTAVNFQTRSQPKGAWETNVHIDVDPNH